MPIEGKVTRYLFPGSIPHGDGASADFPRQLVQQIDDMLLFLNTVRETVNENEENVSAPVGYFPRVKADGGTAAAPRLITWAEKGTTFDDVGASAEVEFQLPDSADYDGDLEVEAPWFHFHNTSGQILRIRAGDADTIQVDVADASTAGGALELSASNSGVKLVLYDDRWRAWDLRGEFEIVA